MNDVLSFVSAVKKSAGVGTLLNLVFSSPRASSERDDLLKIRGTVRFIGGSFVIQMEFRYTEGRVTQENVDLERLSEFISYYFGNPFYRVDMNDKSGTASMMMSKKGKITVLLPVTLCRSLEEASLVSMNGLMDTLAGNDRQKHHVLTGNEAFLVELGISDKNGRVYDKKQAKFRQICRFTELVLELVPNFTKNEEILIADLCCGKSYLSFAVYHALTELAQRKVDMLCVDIKKSVIEFCTQTAKRLCFSGMHFICGDISRFEPERSPDLVISLHACDTATDIVLHSAVRWESRTILSTPCCQKDLSTRLDCPSLAFVAESPALRRNFCATATDALRLLYLESSGYKAQAIEFVDPEDTPKNIMIRASRTTYPKAVLEKKRQ